MRYSRAFGPAPTARSLQPCAHRASSRCGSGVGAARARPICCKPCARPRARPQRPRGSRAAACVVYQLRELDDDGRIEALRLRAAQRGLQLPYETSEYLLKRMPRDMRSLFEILDQLDEASLVAQRRLTIPFIRDALE